MERSDDPFIALPVEPLADDFAVLAQRDVSALPLELPRSGVAPPSAPAVARLHGFDLLGQPLIAGLAACPSQVLTARSVVQLRSAVIGREVVLLFDGGDPGLPIIMGVIELHAFDAAVGEPASGVIVEADGDRHLVTAQREIVLRCGDASITLTRAGTVIIKGNYILSRSTGYNKIKGAAIDIN